jgi:hypothetical protein
MLLGRDGDPMERTTFPLTTNHSWKRKKLTREADIEGNRKTKYEVWLKTLGRCNITTKVLSPPPLADIAVGPIYFRWGQRRCGQGG